MYLAQKGERHERSKALRGFGGSGVIEIFEDDESGTYRTVYTAKIQNVICVLHAFQKKSKQGIKTPQKDSALIIRRLKYAQEMYKES